MPENLNPDALEAGAKAMYNEEPWQKSTYSVESYSWEEIREEDRQAFREEAEVAVSAYLAALPAPRTVETVAELDALPVGSVVLDPFGASATKVNLGVSRPWLGESILWFRVTSALETGYQYRAPHLPARVLWVPTEGGDQM